MPNGVKYSTTTPSGSLRRDNVALGVNGNLGPTANTGFYSMPTPASGKYIINKVAASGVPLFFAPQNDTELIQLARNEGATGANTGSAAAVLSWIATQANLEAANFQYENIVTDGLVLNVDAGFVSSYPTINTTWYDISGNSNNNISLINGPTFNSANSGSIVFDGVDDYSTNSNLKYSPFTYDVFFKGGSGYISRLFGYGWGMYVNGNSIAVWVDTDTSHRSTTTLIAYDNSLITNISVAFANSSFSLYKNGVFIQAVSTPSTSVYSTTTNFYIGTDAPSSGLFIGNIYLAKMYNRALTSTEISQNFNAVKARFGLGLPTNGLIVNLDASNGQSYAGTGTTWYDLSGTGNNAILANGVAFSTSYGGIFDFDGVDDYAYITDNATLDLAGDKSQGIWLYMDQSYSGRGMLGKADSSVNGMALTYGWGGGQGFQNIAWNSANNPTLASNGADISNWYYVAGVQSGSTRYIYVIGANGFRVASFGSGNHSWNNTLNFTIGTIGSYYTNMKAGAVHVYNRALSSGEISAIYSTQKSRFGL